MSLKIYRIVSAIDQGDVVQLTLAENHIENPTTNTVVLDTAHIKSFNLIQYAHRPRVFHGTERPKIMVNSQWMYLERLAYEVDLEAIVGIYPSVIKALRKHRAPAVANCVPTITMIVAWE